MTASKQSKKAQGGSLILSASFPADGGAHLPSRHQPLLQLSELTGQQWLALALAPFVLFVLLVLWPICLMCQGGPFLFGSERAGVGGRPFRLLKVRTMVPSEEPEGVCGTDGSSRITPLGRWLRQLRLDELPQILNVLRGEMRFIGPRPPLVVYAKAFPEIYLPLLDGPPGITGLATVYFCRRETGLLSKGHTVGDVDAIYRRRCVRRKAKLDSIHARQKGAGLTAVILLLTVWRSDRAFRVARRLRRYGRAFSSTK